MCLGRGGGGGLRSFESGLFEGKASDLSSTAPQLKTGGKAVGSGASRGGGGGGRKGRGGVLVLEHRPPELGKHCTILCRWTLVL